MTEVYDSELPPSNFWNSRGKSQPSDSISNMASPCLLQLEQSCAKHFDTQEMGLIYMISEFKMFRWILGSNKSRFLCMSQFSITIMKHPSQITYKEKNLFSLQFGLLKGIAPTSDWFWWGRWIVGISRKDIRQDENFSQSSAWTMRESQQSSSRTQSTVSQGPPTRPHLLKEKASSNTPTLGTKSSALQVMSYTQTSSTGY